MSVGVRLTLDLTRETYDKVTALSAYLECSRSTLLRKSIALVQIAADAQRDGLTLALADGDDRVTTRIVGLWPAPPRKDV